MKTSLPALLKSTLWLGTILFLTGCPKKEDPAPAPVALFDYSPRTNLVAPVTLTFRNLSTNATNYLWETGDGQSSTSEEVTLSIRKAGTYSMTLTAKGEGGSDTYSETIYVDEPAVAPSATVAGFTYSPSQNLTAPVRITFTNTSKNADNYRWDFGDGTTSTEANPVKEYTKAGTMKVKLTAIGNANSADFSADILINAPVASTVPTADFSYTSPSLTAPAKVNFFNRSQNATSYKWEFGDGTTSTAVGPEKEYTKAGDYTVKLTATDAKNQSAQKSAVISVKAAAVPIADWTWSNSGLKVTFSNQSKNATSYNWNFGDGTSSPLVNPVKEYAKAGVYTVTLTASDGKTQDQESKLVTVSASPVANCDWAKYTNDASLKVETKKGSCGTDGLSIKITNKTSIRLQCIWYFETKDGKWSAAASPIDAGNYTTDWSCNNTGRVKVWAMSKEDYEKNRCFYPKP